MSKLSDYSKFDKLVDSDDEREEEAEKRNISRLPPPPPQQQQNSSRSTAEQNQQQQQQVRHPASGGASLSPQSELVGPQHTKDPTTGRYVFTYGSQKVYEWEQSLDSVTLYIDTPPGKTAKDFQINITTKRLQVGLKSHDRFFLDEDFFSLVDTTESCWYLEDNHVLQVVLMKQRRGETWECVLKGGETNAVVKEELQKQLLLERFQEENPGMDFRGATFNGSVPDPRTYMGGIGY